MWLYRLYHHNPATLSQIMMTLFVPPCRGIHHWTQFVKHIGHHYSEKCLFWIWLLQGGGRGFDPYLTDEFCRDMWRTSVLTDKLKIVCSITLQQPARQKTWGHITGPLKSDGHSSIELQSGGIYSIRVLIMGSYRSIKPGDWTLGQFKNYI